MHHCQTSTKVSLQLIHFTIIFVLVLLLSTFHFRDFLPDDCESHPDFNMDQRFQLRDDDGDSINVLLVKMMFVFKIGKRTMDALLQGEDVNIDQDEVFDIFIDTLGDIICDIKWEEITNDVVLHCLKHDIVLSFNAMKFIQRAKEGIESPEFIDILYELIEHGLCLTEYMLDHFRIIFFQNHCWQQTYLIDKIQNL